MKAILTPILTICLIGFAQADRPAIKVEQKDAVVLENFVKFAKSDAAAMTVDHVKKIETPETLCWVDFKQLSISLTAYELTNNVGHLQDFVSGFGNARQAMVQAPDGMLGWVGKPIPPLRDPAKPDVIVCEIQTDFRAIGMLARFIEITGKNEVLLKAFSKEREEYLDLIENHLYKRWEPNFVDLKERGGIYKWNKDYIPSKANLTLAHEKQAILIEALLNLTRATEKPVYRDRVEKLGIFLKSCMKPEGEGYLWNYWDQGGEWDILDGKVKHWVNVEPKGVWYAATVESAVLLYHHGLVFNGDDIKRLVYTQMNVCWNGDAANPVYKLVNGSPAKEKERFIAPALAPWDDKLANFIYNGPLQDDRIAKALTDHWQGGVMANDWLRGKYIDLPKGTSPHFVKPK